MVTKEETKLINLYTNEASRRHAFQPRTKLFARDLLFERQPRDVLQKPRQKAKGFRSPSLARSSSR